MVNFKKTSDLCIQFCGSLFSTTYKTGVRSLENSDAPVFAEDYMHPLALGFGLSNMKPKSANSAKKRPKKANARLRKPSDIFRGV